MKIKNLKITQKALALTGGFVITQAIIYTGLTAIFDGNKPFHENKYETHKFEINEYNQDGNIKTNFYRNNLNISNPAFIIKTPYDNNLQRDIFMVPTTYYSNVEINYLLDNLENQENLLNQDYIKSIIDNLYSNDNYIFLGKETTTTLHKNNDYEIAYATFKEFKDDIKLQSSPITDFLINGTYILCVVGISSCYLLLCLPKEYNNDKVKKYPNN